jgi:IMP dehydrogenase
MTILDTEGLTFDDVLLVPQHSVIESRTAVNTSAMLGTMRLSIPIISANMDTITGVDMAISMAISGGLGVLHRYAEFHQVVEWIHELKSVSAYAVPSVGVQEHDYEGALEYIKAGADAICVDVAHGDSGRMVEMVRFLKQNGVQNIIAGNVVTKTATLRLLEAGANIIKVGVGNGSACVTRTVSGHGVPQLTAIMQCVEAVKEFGSGFIISDGGLNTSGDIVKAIAAGADAVMTGKLLAGTDECPMHGVYRGMASRESQLEFRGSVGNNTPEGVSHEVSYNGPVKEVLEQLVGGLRSGMSYTGANTLQELRGNAIFMKVSNSSLVETATRPPE